MLKGKNREIKRLRDLQGESINDTYTCGLYNGIELALAVLEAREPVFKIFEEEPICTEGKEKKPGRTAYSGVRKRG